MPKETFNINVNMKAPIYSERSILLIGYSQEEIMKRISDINNWSYWRNDISYAKRKENSMEFFWSMGLIKIISTIHTENNSCFGWTGKTFGSYGVHNWSVKKGASNAVEVTESESIEGPMAYFLGIIMRKKLPRILNNNLKNLNFYLEKDDSLSKISN